MMQAPTVEHTIVAQATPPGRGGVGIIRISGSKASAIAERILKLLPQPRFAHYGNFYDKNNRVIDQGIALYFKGPHSFTGEDVLELQAHGGQIIIDELIQLIVSYGAVLAEPGEFSQRAFLNNKIDLTQAEAIADLIAASSAQAAHAAMQSLQGSFAQKINTLLQSTVELRKYVEAALDFPEEEIDFLAEGNIKADLESLIAQVKEVEKAAEQGAILQAGMTVVIAGLPNAGKSSLLNRLAEKEVAIVTDVAGTTRDILREHIHIDGLPLHIIDTAGLHKNADKVEQEGIRRALEQIAKADRVLLVVDSTKINTNDPEKLWPHDIGPCPDLNKITLVRNKKDLPATRPSESVSCPYIDISAQTGEGIEELRIHLKECMGYMGTTESTFSARRRHVDALSRALAALNRGHEQLVDYRAGELLAQELRIAHEALGEITGKFTADDMLGEIFSSFCIGK
jgi:tRNA modification GTPase